MSEVCSNCGSDGCYGCNGEFTAELPEPCDCGECRDCDPHYEERLIEWEKSIDPCDVDRPQDDSYEWDNDAEYADEMSELDEWADDPEPSDIPF